MESKDVPAPAPAPAPGCICMCGKPPPVFWPWQTASMHPKNIRKFLWNTGAGAGAGAEAGTSWHKGILPRHKMATAERTKSVMAHEKLPATGVAWPKGLQPVLSVAKTMAELLRSFGK